MSLNYVLTSNSLCIFHEAKTVEVSKDHLNFKKIVAALNQPSVRFEEIENLACWLNRYLLARAVKSR